MGGLGTPYLPDFLSALEQLTIFCSGTNDGQSPWVTNPDNWGFLIDTDGNRIPRHMEQNRQIALLKSKWGFDGNLDESESETLLALFDLACGQAVEFPTLTDLSKLIRRLAASDVRDSRNSVSNRLKYEHAQQRDRFRDDIDRLNNEVNRLIERESHLSTFANTLLTDVVNGHLFTSRERINQARAVFDDVPDAGNILDEEDPFPSFHSEPNNLTTQREFYGHLKRMTGNLGWGSFEVIADCKSNSADAVAFRSMPGSFSVAVADGEGGVLGTAEFSKELVATLVGIAPMTPGFVRYLQQDPMVNRISKRLQPGCTASTTRAVLRGRPESDLSTIYNDLNGGGLGSTATNLIAHDTGVVFFAWKGDSVILHVDNHGGIDTFSDMENPTLRLLGELQNLPEENMRIQTIQPGHVVCLATDGAVVLLEDQVSLTNLSLGKTLTPELVELVRGNDDCSLVSLRFNRIRTLPSATIEQGGDAWVIHYLDGTIQCCSDGMSGYFPPRQEGTWGFKLLPNPACWSNLVLLRERLSVGDWPSCLPKFEVLKFTSDVQPDQIGMLVEHVDGTLLSEELGSILNEQNSGRAKEILDALLELEGELEVLEISHGDLVPDNIIVTSDSELRLVDLNTLFGTGCIPIVDDGIGGEGRYLIGDALQQTFSPNLLHASSMFVLKLRLLLMSTAGVVAERWDFLSEEWILDPQQVSQFRSNPRDLERILVEEVGLAEEWFEEMSNTLSIYQQKLGFIVPGDWT